MVEVWNSSRRWSTAHRWAGWADPEEIGSIIAFLAGEAASYLTGSEVYADGGWTAK